jgi:hypothetical protein
MNKRFFAICLLIGMSTVGFSMEEQWWLIGFEYTNSFEHSEDTDTDYMGFLGVNISTYKFTDKANVGIFAHFSGMFPPVIGGDDYESIRMWDISTGPACRLILNEKMTLFGGIGPHILMKYPDYKKEEQDYSMEGFNIGFGGDIGLKYDITEKYIFNIGVAFSGDISNRTKIWADKYMKIIPSDYFLYTVKPYIGVGLNEWIEAHSGKPK